MPYVDLTPTHIATNNTSHWTNLAALTSNDNSYVRGVSGMTSSLFVRFGRPVIPKNTIITGVGVSYSARASGISSGGLTMNLFRSSSYTTLGSSRSTPLFNNTETASSVAGSGDLFNFDLKYQDINNNPWYGVKITPTTAVSSQIWIDIISMRVYYEQLNYLTGTRSRFTGRPETELDVVMVNNIASDSLSLIPRKSNGSAIENQIKSEDINLLGDSLYNIESAMLSASSSVFMSDLKKAFAFTITVSAMATSGNPLETNVLVYAKTRKGTQTSSNIVNLSSIGKTVTPSVTGMLNCYFTSVIGWVEQGSGKFPLCVSSTGAFFKRVNNSVDFNISLTALSSGLGEFTDFELNESVTNAYQGYVGSTFSATLPITGKVVFKIMVMGREN